MEDNNNLSPRDNNLSPRDNNLSPSDNNLSPRDKLSLKEFDEGFLVENLCGVDEAGRGPLAGDCYAAAVILPKDCHIEGLNDSKKLSEKKRNVLYDIIIEKAISYSVAVATIEEIENINILNAAMLAMKRAVDSLDTTPDLVIVDGNKNPNINIPCNHIIKGDGISQCIAAASILAKVSRDRYMEDIAKQYPQYEFNRHKGYGTKLHYEKITEFGVSDIHRKSFLKKFFVQEEKNKANKILGDFGEKQTVKYLEKKGFTIIDTKFLVKYGEIDIIAKKDEMIYFVEVKTRKNIYIPPQDAVDYKKRKKIIAASDVYLEKNDLNCNSMFCIAEVVVQEKVYINFIENAFYKE